MVERSRDRIDDLAAQWARERPDVAPDVMALVARLLRVAALIGQRIDAFASRHGLSRADGDLLFTLRRAGSPYRLSPSALSRSLLVASGTMTNRLDRLERRGLVTRVPNPEDRRGLDVQLTPEALELVDAIVGEHVANEERMLEPLSGAERAQLAAITRKLLAHLE